MAILCVDHPAQWSLIDAAELEISNRLHRDPLKYSEHVHEGLRRIIIWPLAVYFAIDVNRVKVGSVGWIK